MKKVISKKITLFLTLMFTCLFFISTAAMAQATFPEPTGDITALLLKLATSYKTLGLFGILSILVILSVQAIKQWVSDTWKYKRLLTLFMSIVYSIISGLVIEGSNVLTVVVTVFVTSGGAMALYEALVGAGIIKKK